MSNYLQIVLDDFNLDILINLHSNKPKTYGRVDEKGNLILPSDDEDKDDDWGASEAKETSRIKPLDNLGKLKPFPDKP